MYGAWWGQTPASAQSHADAAVPMQNSFPDAKVAEQSLKHLRKTNVRTVVHLDSGGRLEACNVQPVAVDAREQGGTTAWTEAVNARARARSLRASSHVHTPLPRRHCR